MTQNDHKPQSYQDAVDSGLPAISGGGMAMNTVAAREIGEIQGAIVVAQRVPRNEERAFKEIMNACKRETLARSATYLFPRGGQTVTGPSIRLAEVLARYWGNIQYGIRELARTDKETLFESYCWDVQTNTRVSRRFSQKHWRDRKNGQGYALTDERDIYEAVANSGARRLRACILEVIPGDVVEEALRTCAATKIGKSDVPMKDRLRNLIVAFDQFGVTEDMIVAKLEHKLDQISPEELAELRDIYTSIKDGMSSRDQWFSTTQPSQDENADLNAKFANPDDPTPPAAAKTAKSKKEPKKEPAKKKGRPKSAADDAKRDLDVQEKTINGSGVAIDAPIPGEKADQMETGSFANF